MYEKNKNNEVVKYMLENYDIQNANDTDVALKDMCKLRQILVIILENNQLSNGEVYKNGELI